MTAPLCPRCAARMVRRVNRETHDPFWGCHTYPRCQGTLPWADPEPERPSPREATLHAQLRQTTRERDTLRAGYDQLLAEVRQLRRLRAPQPDQAAVIRELTRLLAVCHPDKWGGESAVATALTQELLAVRARLREGRL